MTRSEEAPSGRNKWRHQCGRTTADLAAEAQQAGWKPASGVVRLQTGGTRTCPRKAMQQWRESFAAVTVHQPREGEQKKWKMEYITPGPCGLPLVPLYGFRCTSVHKTQRQYWDYIKVVIFHEWERGWLLMIFFPPPPTQPVSPHPTTDTLTDSRNPTPNVITLRLHFRASIFLKLWHMWIWKATKRT